MSASDWEPRTTEAQRALQELRQLLPEADWDWGVPSSFASPANGALYPGVHNCGKTGLRILSSRGSLFVPRMCRTCPRCVHESNLILAAEILSAAHLAASQEIDGQGALYVQVFDLEAIAERVRVQGVGPIVFVNQETGAESGRSYLRSGFRLQSKKEVDKVRDFVRQRVRYQGTKGKAVGACVFSLATYRGVLGNTWSPLAAEDFRTVPALVVVSDQKTRQHKASPTPSQSFSCSPREFANWIWQLLDVSRERVFNPSSEKGEGRATRVSYYGSWRRPKPRTFRGGALRIPGQRVGEWPWNKLDEALTNSAFDQQLKVLSGQALAAIPEADTLVSQYRALLRCAYKASQAETMFRERATELRVASRRSTPSKKVIRLDKQAEAVAEVLREFRSGRLLDTRVKLESVWPYVRAWDYSLGLGPISPT